MPKNWLIVGMKHVCPDRGEVSVDANRGESLRQEGIRGPAPTTATTSSASAAPERRKREHWPVEGF